MPKLKYVIGLVAVLTFVCPAGAQDVKSSIVGIWKLTSHANKNPATGAVTHPFGQHPQGYQVFGKSGHMMFTMFAENRKAGTTDADRALLLQSLTSYVGTYSVDGSKVRVSIQANATPS